MTPETTKPEYSLRYRYDRCSERHPNATHAVLTRFDTETQAHVDVLTASAVCSPKDQFIKHIGRTIARGRLHKLVEASTEIEVDVNALVMLM